MREIMFRGYDGMAWVFGSAVRYDGFTKTWYMIENSSPDDDWIMVGEIGQYTGLRDKNDVGIFEGDIILITFDTDYSEKEHYIGYVIYQDKDGYPAFDLVPWIDCEMNALCWLKSESDPSVKWYEVIGNLHDNPELLEGDDDSERD